MGRRVVAVFWNPATRRPRFPWRVIAAFVVLALLSVPVALVDPIVRPSLESVFALVVPGAQAAAAAGNVVFLSAQTTGYVGAVYLSGRFLDRRRFRDFGLHVDRDWWIDLGFGLALGAGLMTAIVLIELAAGWLAVTGTFRIARPGFAFWPWFGWTVVTFVGVGVTEELLARGYLITNLAEGLTWADRLGPGGATGLAVLGSATAFAGGHLANPNAGPASFAGILLASVMLAVGYVLTGELAIPIGTHVTWNLFQGPVYGLPVSGIDLGLSVLAIEQRGPPAVTGGPFGPEAGLLGAVANLAGIALIAAWVYRRQGRVGIDPSLTTPDRRG